MRLLSCGVVFREPAATVISRVKNVLNSEFPPDRFQPLLVGSFSRDEQTSIHTESGKWVVLGDVELLLVTSGSGVGYGEERRIRKAKAAAEAKLSDLGIQCEVDLGVIDIRHVRNPANTIFWAEVHANGVLLGEDIFGMSDSAGPGLRTRGPYDASHLLGNRAVELLRALSSWNGKATLDWDLSYFRSVQYPIVKAVVDSYTALTVLCNQFKPSYLARLGSLEVIGDMVVPSCFSREEWEVYADLVKGYTRLKCGTYDSEKQFQESVQSVVPESREVFVDQAIRCLLRIACLCNPKTGTSRIGYGPRPILMTRGDFARTFTTASRLDIRSWVKVCWMHNRSSGSIPRLTTWRNLFRGPPRAMVYELSFYLLERRRREGTLDGESEHSILEYLPTCGNGSKKTAGKHVSNRALAAELIRNWEEYIKNG